MAVAVVLTVVTGLDYVLRAIRLRRGPGRCPRTGAAGAGAARLTPAECGACSPWADTRLHDRSAPAAEVGTVSVSRRPDPIVGHGGARCRLLLREAIGASIRRVRTAQQRSLREVSRRARVSLGYLSEVERGRKEASSELLAAICEALDLPLPELLDDAPTMLRPLPGRQVPIGLHGRGDADGSTRAGRPP